MKKVDALFFTRDEFDSVCDKVLNERAWIEDDSGSWFWVTTEEIDELEIVGLLEKEFEKEVPGFRIENILVDIQSGFVVVRGVYKVGKKMYDDVVERLNNKNEELTKLQEQFKVMCHNDMQSQCFEQNAIHSLIVMQRLKSEIEELEYWEMYVRAQTTNAD